MLCWVRTWWPEVGLVRGIYFTYRPLDDLSFEHITYYHFQLIVLIQRVQVGRMGYIPAYGDNGNSRNVSCSKPSLHCHKRPWEGALYINGWQEAPLTLCIWRYINEVHLHLHCNYLIVYLWCKLISLLLSLISSFIFECLSSPGSVLGMALMFVGITICVSSRSWSEEVYV